MDLKSLISKMDQIESKKFLTESEKKETSWTDIKGNKHTATQVKGKSYGNQPEPKEVDNEGKPKSKKVKEGLGIADALMEEFGLSEQAPDWQKDVRIDGVNAAGEFKFSPEQEKWLGNADRQDPNVISRMPGPKPPVSYFKDPANQALAKQMKFPAAPAAKAAPAAAPAANQGTGGLEKTAPGVSPVVGAMASGKGAAADSPETSYDSFGNPVPKGSAAATSADPTGTAAAPKQAAQPAAKPAAKQDPKVLALQQKLIAAGAKIKADGIMGPQTQAAMKQFPQAVSGNVPLPAGVKPSTAGGGRGSVNPAAATSANQTAQVASRTGVNPVTTAGGGRGGMGGPSAAQMGAGNPEIARIDNQIRSFQSNPRVDMSLPMNQKVIRDLEAKKQAILNRPVSGGSAGNLDMTGVNVAAEAINSLRKLAGL